ncbi:MAG: ATP-binding protein [Deltaproteobacteria bacterium]|nr:ATP-binding protein [Deltaproteobacteria bacterium]
MENQPDKPDRKVTGMTDYIKKVLEHDFKYLSDVPDIPDKELSLYIKVLAEEYKNSLLRAEETVRNLAAVEEKNEKLIERQNVVLNNSLVGITMVKNRIFVHVNKKMAEIFGYDSPEDMVGKSSRIVYASEEDFKKVGNNAYSTLSEGKEFRLEYIAKRKDGSEFWCLLSGKSINRNDGALSSDSVWVFQDITKEKEIDIMKTDFISTVSHELRTPLTSVMGFANIIRKKFKDSIMPLLDIEDKKTKKTTDQIESNLDIIISEGQRLTTLINDVLDIAKMEAGKIDWNVENFAVKDAIDRAIAATVSLLDQKGLNMVTDIENNLPEILGDKDRFIQVIINLISNAVKFTNSGNITIRAKVESGAILVSVADQGIGISKENADKVFEKFKQVGDTLTDKPQGTGLGLPICKQIIEHYGGKIWVDSEEGKGSTFYFTFPYSNKEYYDSKIGGVNKIDIKSFIGKLNDSAWQLPESSQPEKNILIVDDDPGIRELLKQELENAGYITDQAVDGIEALSKIKRKKYNLVILDVMMPGLNGFDLSAVLKSNPDTMNIPIMILSMLEDRKRGFEVGADKYLTKGIDSQNLLKEVGQIISMGSSKRKVMIIDKDKSIFNLLTDVMREKGYTVMGISSKADADYIAKIKTEQPDIIIVDEFVAHEETTMKALKAADESGSMVTFIIIGRDAQKISEV